MGYQEEQRRSLEYFHRKWSKPRVVIWTGPAWEPWTRFSVEKGMAGSETWAAYLAEEFAILGYDVTIYGHLDDPKAQLVLNGVTYADHRRMINDLMFVYVDLFISSRNVDIVTEKIHALKTYIMIHDIWLHPDQKHDMQTWRVNRYYYLSDWHKGFIKEHHSSIPEEKLFKTSNGIPFEYYSDHHMYTKCNMSVYSSSPDRGLLQLLECMPDIRKAVPDFELVVCYGFHNWESAAKLRNDHQSLRMIERIKVLMEQPGVIYKGRVSKIELAKYQMEAKVWLMPEWFTETFSITAIENRAALNGIITTDLGGLKDTVGDAGVLLPPHGLSREEPLPEEYKQKFIEEAIKMLTDEEYRLSWVNKTTSKSLEQYRWSEIVKDFVTL
jgi:glycosyltransferase involved in cell wall biosynthesis